MSHFTTIAAIPRAGGCMSALAPERHAAKPVAIDPPQIEEDTKTAQPSPMQQLASKYLAACLLGA